VEKGYNPYEIIEQYLGIIYPRPNHTLEILIKKMIDEERMYKEGIELLEETSEKFSILLSIDECHDFVKLKESVK
jgi:hypothetical protein